MNSAAKTEPFEALACIRCGGRYPADFEIDSRGCPACVDAAPSNLAVSYSAGAESDRRWPPSSQLPGFRRFACLLPVREQDIVTLGEGNTATVAADHLGKELDIAGLFVKDGSRNPTWSHKDRFSCIAVKGARPCRGAPFLDPNDFDCAGRAAAGDHRNGQ